MPFPIRIDSHFPPSSKDQIAPSAHLRMNEKRSLAPVCSRPKSSLSPFLALVLIQSMVIPDSSLALQSGGVEIGDLETGSVVGQPFHEIDMPVLQMALLGLEVTQAIQGMNPADPLDSQTNNTVTLVAGKKTIVRAYFNLTGALSVEKTLRIQGTLGGAKNGSSLGGLKSIGDPETPGTQGTLLADLLVQADNGKLNEKRKLLKKSLNFELDPAWTKQGKLTLTLGNTFSLGSSKVRCASCNTSIEVKFVPSAPLKLKIIKYIKNADPIPDFGIHIAHITSWLKRAFPIAPEDLQIEVEPLVQSVSSEVLTGLSVFLETASKRTYDKANYPCRYPPNHTIRYIGLFPNPGQSSGDSYGGPGRTPSDNTLSASVPIGTPSSWSCQFGWDKDQSYADAYSGHELGHTFGLGHLPFGVCDQTPVEPYDPAFDNGFISGPDHTYFGFDVGDKFDNAPAVTLFSTTPLHPSPLTWQATEIPMQPLAGDQWHDMMGYSDYWWVSARLGGQSGRSYEWIRCKLIDENASRSATFPFQRGSATCAFTTTHRDLHSSQTPDTNDGFGYLRSVSHVGTTSAESTADVSGVGTLQPQRALTMFVLVNLTKNTWKVVSVQYFDQITEDNAVTHENSYIQFMGKGDSLIGKRIPVLVLRSSDASPKDDRTLLVEATLPLPEKSSISDLRKLNLVISKNFLQNILEKATNYDKDLVIGLPISQHPPRIEGIRVYGAHNDQTKLSVEQATTDFLKARQNLSQAHGPAEKAAAENEMAKAKEHFNNVLLTPGEHINPPVTLRWVVEDEDESTKLEDVTYTVRVSVDKGRNWQTLAVAYRDTTLTIRAEQFRALGLQAPTEILLQIIGNDGFHDSKPENIQFIVQPASESVNTPS